MEKLLPPEIFMNLSTGALAAAMVASIVLVIKGADWLVTGAVGISERLGVPKVIIGATIVSLGTTTPEAAVSVLAAFNGLPDLALGNAVGSIICDTGLIFGLCCLIARLPMDRFVLNRHGWVQFGSGAMLVAVCWYFVDPNTGLHMLPRVAGFAFVGLLVAYMGISIYWARVHPSPQMAIIDKTGHEIPDEVATRPLPIEALSMVLGLTLVIFSSHIMVTCVSIICERLKVPPAVIAATVVAVGTSMPELVTALASVAKGHGDLMVGNIIGADVLNVLFVAGLSACAAPLVVDPLFFRLHFPVMIAILLVFRLTIAFSKTTFARWPGALLIAIHLGYMAANYFMGVDRTH